MATAIASPGPTPEAPAEGRALAAFGLIGWRWISRNPASAIAPILQPFIFLYFLSLISPAGIFPLEVLGAMLFTTQNIGSWVMGDSATWRIELGVQDMFVASPLGKLRYLFGVAFSNLIAAAPALLVLAVLLDVSLPHRVPWTAWVVLAGCLSVVWMLFSAIGVAISSRLTSQREIWPVGNLTFTVVGMLSPLYYPLSYLPPWWQKVAHLLPSTYAALLVQSAFGITPAPLTSMIEYAALLVVLALIGTTLAIRMYRWRTS
jgi:ABC-type multidrug transport system permease subunit